MDRENPFDLGFDDGIKYDVVIIGAGLSGLTAAYRLLNLKPDMKIKILEAKDRIGGRVMSTELPAMNNTTDVWDMGGCWVGNQALQPFINQLLAELTIHTYPQNFKGKKYLQTGRNFDITEHDSSIPDVGIMSLIDTATLIKYLNNVQKKISSSRDIAERESLTLDSKTAETMIQKKTWTKCTFDCARAAFRGVVGSELNKLSGLYFILLSNSCGGIMNMLESGESSSQGYKIAGGAQRICFRILELIGSNKLQLETIVTDIEKVYDDEGEPLLVIKTTSGANFRTKYAVLAIPPHLIPNIQFNPPLSPTKMEFFSSVSPSHAIKVILTYETAFWKKEGYSGEIVTNGGKSEYEDCDSGPLCIVFDGTTSNKSPALVCMICGQQALQYENKTKSQRKEAILTSLECFFKKELVRNFIVYCEKIWRHERFIGGCPVCTVPPGVARHLNKTLRAPENGIFFAGSELSTEWMGFMEGAVQSGESAALQILSNY